MTASDPRVGEIQARLDAATPGRWYAEGDPGDVKAIVKYTSANGISVGTFITDFVEKDADSEFIAHATADVAYLLAELADRDEKLARVEKVRQELFDISNDEGWTIQHRAAYRDASRAIRTAVATAKGSTNAHD